MKALVPKRARQMRQRLRSGWRRAPRGTASPAQWCRFLFELGSYAGTGRLFSSASALRYCVGRGLEIGGSAHNPFRLNTLNVDLTDDFDTPFKRAEIAACGSALPVDIVAAGDALPVADGSQDFIVSSHVLEHFDDPVKALLEWNRVVRPGGVIFMIVPHKDRTFDKDRPRTTLEHLVGDHEAAAPEPHEDPNGHNHVWVTEDVVELVSWMRGRFALGWEVVEVQDRDDKVGNGFTVVIRKNASPRQSGE